MKVGRMGCGKMWYVKVRRTVSGRDEEVESI